MGRRAWPEGSGQERLRMQLLLLGCTRVELLPDWAAGGAGGQLV